MAQLGEEDLRNVLLCVLNSHFEGTAGGEVFNGEGKTDILIRERDDNVFIAELKIWPGPKKFGNALDQLLGYLTWRDQRAALIPLVRERDVSGIVTKVAAVMQEHPRFVRALARNDPSLRQDFVFHAQDDKTQHITVAVLPVALPPPG